MTKLTWVLILNVMTFSLLSQNNITVNIEFSGLKSHEGSLRIGLFKTQEKFDSEEPFQFFVVSKKEVKNGVLTKSFQLPVGEYGISVIDDVNNNKKLDKSMLGIPKEGYGFGNYIHKGFSSPKFSDFKMKVDNESDIIKVIFRYLI